MDMGLKVVMGVLYVLATIIIVATFYRRADLHSWLAIGHGVTLYLASVVLPARWTRSLMKKLRERGVALDNNLQVTIVMPSGCAVVAALIALSLVRG